jgi:hypothetical protein
VRVPPTDVATQPVQWQSTAHFETDSESDSESTSDNDLVQSEAPDTEQVLDNYVKNKDEIILDDDDVKGEVKPATTSVDDGSDDERDTAPIESAPDRQRVLVQRACAIDKCRHLLPILADEQRIVEAINEHDVGLASSSLRTRVGCDCVRCDRQWKVDTSAADVIRSRLYKHHRGRRDLRATHCYHAAAPCRRCEHGRACGRRVSGAEHIASGSTPYSL